MTAPRDMNAVLFSLESQLRLATFEMHEARRADTAAREIHEITSRRMEQAEKSARAVLSLRKADDVAFRAAVTVLVTDILGPGAWDSSTSEKETMP
jgi:hypothetical protein